MMPRNRSESNPEISVLNEGTSAVQTKALSKAINHHRAEAEIFQEHKTGKQMTEKKKSSRSAGRNRNES
jgi:hypothetical protein